MARQRRTLLLALTAALALAALAPATTAARVTFTTPRPATLKGARTGPDAFTAGGVAKECPQVSFRGTLRGSSRTLRLEPIYGEPVYSGCVADAFGGLRAKFVWSECSYLLHPTGRISGKDRWGANVDIACPGKASLAWNVYENKQDFEQGYTLCTTAMPSQAGLGTAELRNVGGAPSKIAIHWNLRHIAYRAYGSSLLCGPLFELRRDASYRGDATIGAKDSLGQTIDLAVSG